MILPKSENEDYFGTDPPHVRNACLNCEKPKCNNCMRFQSQKQMLLKKNDKEKKKC